MDDDAAIGGDVGTERKVPKEFSSHPIFADLNMAADFYETLSDLVFPFVSRTSVSFGLDSTFFDSLAGTVDSIRTLLQNGYLGDAYTLLRRFREVGWLQVYVMIRLKDQILPAEDMHNTDQPFTFEFFVGRLEDALWKGIYVEEIDKWMAGEESLPPIRVFNQHIDDSPVGHQLHHLFDSGHKEIQSRCNDHVHVNFFHYCVRISLGSTSKFKWPYLSSSQKTSEIFSYDT